MRHTSLKKIGAIALAAVMAVTFAPVASLTAFAGNVGVNDDKTTLEEATVVLEETGNYKVKTGQTITALTIRKPGTYNIDLNEQTVTTLTITNVKAVVTITDSDEDMDGTYGTIGTLELGASDALAAASEKPAITLNNCNVSTAVTFDWGDLTVNDGATVAGKITMAVGVAEGDGAGADHTPGTIGDSSLTINGGTFSNAAVGGAYEDTAAAATSTLAADGTEQLGKVSITGGVFKFDPTKLEWYASKSAKDKSKMLDAKTPVARIDQEVGDYAVGDSIAKDFARAAVQTALKGNISVTPNVTVIQGAVSLEKAPAGTVATCTNTTTNGQNDGKSLSISAASGVSVYHENQDESYNDGKNRTVIDNYYFGDDPIAAKLDRHKVGFDPNTTDKNIIKGDFNNGGNTLEVDINGDKYVVSEDNIVALADAATAKTVDVKCLKSEDGDITFTAANTNAKYTANSKYTMLTGKNGANTVKEVTMSPKSDTDDWSGTDVSTNDVNVDQLGESGIGEGANGILILDMSNDGKKVTTTDETLPLSYTTLGGGNVLYFVGDAANQVAAGSTIGLSIISNYAVAKDVGIARTDNLNNAGAKSTMTFVQGGLTLPDVAVDKNLYNKDDTATAITFVDGAELGITKTANYGTNEQGIYSVYSVDVTVGTGANVPKQVCRFKNIATGVHLYTIDAGEIENLTKSGEWKLENAQAFKVLPYNTTVAGAVPVRRYMNVHTGEFLYSTDVNGEQKVLDKSSDWIRQGIAFCGVAPGKGYAITRVRNTIKGDHVYSTSYKGEVEPLLTKPGYEVDGWPFEAVDIPANEK